MGRASHRGWQGHEVSMISGYSKKPEAVRHRFCYKALTLTLLPSIWALGSTNISMHTNRASDTGTHVKGARSKRLPLVPSPTREHMLVDRTVQMKITAQGGDAFLPSIHYHAKSSATIASLHHELSSGDSERSHPDLADAPDLSMVRSEEDLSAWNLSESSKAMIRNIDSLDPKELDRLRQKIVVEHHARQELNPATDLQILYVDSHICVVNKPGGILSVPGARRNPSLVELVYNCLAPPIDMDQMVCHRLDMSTSGILVFALSLQALTTLHTDFKDRKVQKTYEALVRGHVHGEEGEIDVALERDPENLPFMRIAQTRSSEAEQGTTHKLLTQPPKDSFTDYRVLSTGTRNGAPVTRLELQPRTGRTHQLRVHCAAAIGPIWGDEIYGHQSEEEISSGLCLHARRLALTHPISGGRMVFEADPPF